MLFAGRCWHLWIPEIPGQLAPNRKIFLRETPSNNKTCHHQTSVYLTFIIFPLKVI